MISVTFESEGTANSAADGSTKIKMNTKWLSLVAIVPA
jgi:hypothetical protein